MLGSARVGAIIPVSDRKRAIDYYQGTLGLRLLEETSEDVMFEAGAGTILSIYESVGAGQSRHTLAAFLVDDLEAAVADLRQRGVTIEEYDLPDVKTVDGIAELEGERAAWFKDPDGNILAVGERTGSRPG